MNSTARIILQEGNAYQPFDQVSGTAQWQLDAAPRQLELRLFWFIEALSDTESTHIATQVLQPTAKGEAAFHFSLPNAPYSFQGVRLSVQWAIELVATPGNSLAMELLTVSPTRRVLTLRETESSANAWWKKFGQKR